MAFTTVAFCEEPAVTTEEPVAAVSDDTHRTSGDDIYIGELNRIIAMFGGGSHTSYMKLVSPSLRRNFCPYIHPYFSAAPDAYWAMNPVIMNEHPIPLETNEQLECHTLQTVADTSVDNFCGVSLAEAAQAPVKGDIRCMYDETTATYTQKTWVSSSLTLPVDLPVGRYQIVGAAVRCTYPGIFRFILPDSKYRPGGMIDGGDHIMIMDGQRMGRMGVWGEFFSINPPKIEICSHVQNAWAAIKMDLIKIG